MRPEGKRLREAGLFSLEGRADVITALSYAEVAAEGGEETALHVAWNQRRVI